MKTLYRYVLSFLVVGFISPEMLFDGAIRHDVPDEKYLEMAHQPQFDSVGLIIKDDKPNASAVLINTTWALTAGHVVFDQVPASFRLQFGSKRYSIVEIVIYSDYESAGILGHNGDLALLRLSQPVESISPAIFYRGRGEQGLTGTTVGFGRSGAGASIITNPTPVGTKRAGKNVIDSIGGIIDGREIPSNLLVSDFDHPDVPELNRIGDSNPLDLEYCPVGGDSGGGLFIFVDGSWYLAGIVSAFTLKINDNINLGLAGSLIYWTRLSDYTEWIESGFTE